MRMITRQEIFDEMNKRDVAHALTNEKVSASVDYLVVEVGKATKNRLKQDDRPQLPFRFRSNGAKEFDFEGLSAWGIDHGMSCTWLGDYCSSLLFRSLNHLIVEALKKDSVIGIEGIDGVLYLEMRPHLFLEVSKLPHWVVSGNS